MSNVTPLTWTFLSSLLSENRQTCYGTWLMMSIHVLVINCLMHNPDAFAERTVRAATAEKFKADPTFKNMMKYLIDQILMRRRTVQRATNDWDSEAYLQDEDEDTHQQWPSRSRRTLAHPHPTSQDSSGGPSTSRRHVPSASTGRGRTSRRRPSTLEVSGITALADSEDEEDQPLARARQKTRYRASPLDQEDDLCQGNEASNSRQKKNKRPLNGPSLAKNRRQPSPLEDEDYLSEDNEASNSRRKKNKRPLNGPSLAKNRRQPRPCFFIAGPHLSFCFSKIMCPCQLHFAHPRE